ncbi:MAG TPA: TIGR03668 family PPOX class F420-dependent oxidoreductase, partial [Candidatus Tumulicola sp.]|nr:TIGR03668 family PPOX class F420-dependent oxidoreductase [Candidatus Tumulicola sp.]
MRLDDVEARRRFANARVARLATVDEAGRPHIVPVVFVVIEQHIYSAVDAKPKTTKALRRLANISANPRVSLLTDHYADGDWDALWWVRADGEARVIAPDAPEAEAAVDGLIGRYSQYREHRPDGPVLAVAVRRWRG